jgi:hypothetical protein
LSETVAPLMTGCADSSAIRAARIALPLSAAVTDRG